MISILILLALSAASGYALGKSHLLWPALLAAGAVLAPLSAVVLHQQGFNALPGISLIVMCLAFNQAAYLIAIRLNNDRTGRICRRFYLRNEPATYHTTVATMTSAANPSLTNTLKSSLASSPSAAGRAP